MKYKIQISRVDRTRITEKGEYHCETAPTYEHIDGYTHWKKKIDGIVQEDRQLYILAVLKNIGLKE